MDLRKDLSGTPGWVIVAPFSAVTQSWLLSKVQPRSLDMNTPSLAGLMTLITTATLAVPLTAMADACDPSVIHSNTTYPDQSLRRNQSGTVYINVTVDEQGRAQSAELQRSSGYSLLDRAAMRSVLQNWVFDVSTCERKDLPANDLVGVEYRNAGN